MADINKLYPKILKHEGGFGNDPIDHGGATNMGITLENWKIYGYDKDLDGDIDVEDLKILTVEDFKKFFKERYWDKYWKADFIHNQSVANILVDWCYNSGAWGVKIPQRLLGVVVDGQAGPKTLMALNLSDQFTIFQKIWDARRAFYYRIVERSVAEYKQYHPNATEKQLLKYTQKKFLKGWINRLCDYEFES